MVLHLRKNMGLRRQAASHLQHPRGPAEVSRLLSVSDARVWSVDMEEMSLMEEEGGRLSLLFTAAPVLRESTAAGGYNVKESRRKAAAENTKQGGEGFDKCWMERRRQHLWDQTITVHV